MNLQKPIFSSTCEEKYETAGSFLNTACAKEAEPALNSSQERWKWKKQVQSTDKLTKLRHTEWQNIKMMSATASSQRYL